MSDSHKIRVQLCLDVQAFGKELSSVGVDIEALKASATTAFAAAWSAFASFCTFPCFSPSAVLTPSSRFSR